jgi:hypothetical protein
LAEFGAKTIKTGSLEFFGCYMYNKIMIMLNNYVNAAADMHNNGKWIEKLIV